MSLVSAVGRLPRLWCDSKWLFEIHAILPFFLFSCHPLLFMFIVQIASFPICTWNLRCCTILNVSRFFISALLTNFYAKPPPFCLLNERENPTKKSDGKTWIVDLLLVICWRGRRIICVRSKYNEFKHFKFQVEEYVWPSRRVLNWTNNVRVSRIFRIWLNGCGLLLPRARRWAEIKLNEKHWITLAPVDGVSDIVYRALIRVSDGDGENVNSSIGRVEQDDFTPKLNILENKRKQELDRISASRAQQRNISEIFQFIYVFSSFRLNRLFFILPLDLSNLALIHSIIYWENHHQSTAKTEHISIRSI